MENNNQKVLGGLFWSYGERIMAQTVSLIVSIILARLLTPDDYGVISIVMIFITFCNAIVTGGFGNSIIQKKDADELDVNTMLFCSVIISIILYLVVFFCAPYIAAFYEVDIICPVLRVLGIRLLISGVNSIQRAWIQKRMLFKRFFLSTSIGTIVSAAIGIAMAYFKFGVWALVAQYLTNSFIDTIILYVTNEWRPKFEFSFMRAKEMLAYGWKVLLTTIIYTLEADLRSIIVGKKFGAAELAFYDQGKKFPQLIVNNINASISSVVFPVLSNNQDNLLQLKRMSRRAIKTAMFLLSPLLIGLIAIADTFVIVILSDKWVECIPFLRILSLVFLVRPFTVICQQSILAVGRSDVTLKIEIVVNTVAIGMIFVAVFIIGDVIWIAIGALLTEIIGLFLWMYYVRHVVKYNYWEQLQDLLPSLIMASLMGIVVVAVARLQMSKFIVLIVQILIGAIWYVVISYFLQLDAYVYLIRMFQKKIKSEKIKKILEKGLRSKS